MSRLSWLDRVLIVGLSTLALLVPFGRAEVGATGANPVSHTLSSTF